ncbi:M24 family metallopeptidase [Lentibacillus saliphilus]|uniref:M24 family metallopeptidase n=1 Tax=Lentibacillus saliphilus TaxID=2737028 RepID=UPI001C30CA91|nr:Xaa-Pro peptidase family protein [Lentibacillus saliphilus]
MTDQLNHLLKDMMQQNMDSVLVTSQANVFYLSGYDSDPHERVIALFADLVHEPILIVPSMEAQDAQKAGWSHNIIAYHDHENPWDLLLDQLNTFTEQPKTIGLEYDHLTLERYYEVSRIMPNINTVDAQGMLSGARRIKQTDEYNHLKEAAQLADYGVELGVAALKEGVSELEVIAAIEFGLKQRGVEAMSFSTMVLFGEKAASPHGTPGTRQLKAGDLVLFDLGVIHKGYCSDISRTVAYQSINEQQQKIYNTVLVAQQKAIDHSMIGTPVGEIDSVARTHIAAEGFGEHFPHRIGHGIGIQTHEGPSMHSDNTLPLESGMCYTIEPGIYVSDLAGVRIEDMIYMTNDGAEVLTQYPKDLQIIE